MKYSIIIPHYNSQELLIRCIESIPDNEKYQIIVVDDCSPKSVDFDYILSHITRRIQLEILTTNQGPGVARNVGLNLAKGEWILFLDADDYFLPSVNEIFERATECSHSDIIFFNIDEAENDTIQGQKYYNYVKNYNKSENAKIDLKFRTWAPWAKLFRKDFVKANNLLFGERRLGEDGIFVLNAMIKAKSIEVIDVPVYHLSYSPQSLCHAHQDDWNYRYEGYDLWLWLYRFYKDNDILLWKEYNIFYILNEVRKSFGFKCCLKILLRGHYYRYSYFDLLISKICR